MLVKNEIDIIEYNIEYLQTQNIDHFYIANNLSTDGTKEKLLELSEKYGNIEVFDDRQFSHEQGRKMNNWIRESYQKGSDIIVPIDADEIWYSKVSGNTLGEVLKENSECDCIFVAQAIDFIPTKNDLKSDNPFESMIYKKVNSNSFSSVAFTKNESAVITEGNHDVQGHSGKRIYDLIGIKHYQYRSFNQFVSKVRNGKNVLNTMPEYIGSHWRKLGSMSKCELENWWKDYTSQPTELYKG
jgi:glycosyltransferase involved in cell wall biosynthesis